MDVQCLVARDGPGRGCPDHRVYRPFRQIIHVHGKCACQFFALVLGKLEADIDGKVLLVRILDLGLGQGRCAVEAPVHRLQAAVDVALLQQFAQRADLVGLVAVGHGQIGMVPVAEHAQALEILFLPLDLLRRIGAAQALRLLHRQVLAVLLFDLALDRHAVTVPAWHVHGVEARQVARLDDDVLQNLVHRMADVDVAVGVGRAVVQDELRPAVAGCADFAVKPSFLPALDPLRLAPGKVAAHGERRVGKVQRVLVISHIAFQ